VHTRNETLRKIKNKTRLLNTRLKNKTILMCNIAMSQKPKPRRSGGEDGAMFANFGDLNGGFFSQGIQRSRKFYSQEKVWILN
jgi:hypothetical protein